MQARYLLNLQKCDLKFHFTFTKMHPDDKKSQELSYLLHNYNDKKELLWYDRCVFI